jgi:regulator of cell morphogenesis and NO signaling
VETHNSFTTRILPEISEFATKILRVHGSNHKELFRIHKLFHSLKMDLEQHLIKEEEILFPLIKEYDINPSDQLLAKIQDTVRETEEEHTAAGDILKELREITNDYNLPVDACGSYRLTYEKLTELESDLFQHIHLENNILFHRLGITIE